MIWHYLWYPIRYLIITKCTLKRIWQALIDTTKKFIPIWSFKVCFACSQKNLNIYRPKVDKTYRYCNIKLCTYVWGHSITTWTRFRGSGSVESPRGSHVTKGRYVVCKIYFFVHLKGLGGQNWVKFGPRRCWMAPWCH